MIQFTANNIRYNGNAISTSFDFPFRIFEASDINVYVNGVLQTFSADYNVTWVPLEDGGTVTFFSPPPEGDNNVLIERSVPYTQTIAIPEGSKFPARLVETGMDRIVVMLHQLFDSSIRGMSVASVAMTGNEDLEIKQNASERADRVVSFSPDGNQLIVGPTVTELVSLAVNSSALVLPASSLAGRGSAGGNGAVQAITLGTGLVMNGTTLSAAGGDGIGDHTRFEGRTEGLLVEVGKYAHYLNPDRITLRECSSLVTDAGTIVTPRKGLVCDFGTVGAGGRDVADQKLSGHRWWKLWYIFKPTDNSISPTEDALLLSEASVLVEAAKYKATNGLGDITEIVNRNSAVTHLAMGFVMDEPLDKLKYVALRKSYVGTRSGDVWITIETDNSGDPSGTVLATSRRKDASLPTGVTNAWTPFLFDEDQQISLQTGTQYHIVLRSTLSLSATNYTAWYSLAVGTYPNGRLKTWNGAAWVNVSTYDGLFSVVGTKAEVNPVMPSQYTEKCLLGYIQTAADGNSVYSATLLDRQYISRTGVNSDGARIALNASASFNEWVPNVFGHALPTQAYPLPSIPTLTATLQAYSLAGTPVYTFGGPDSHHLLHAETSNFTKEGVSIGHASGSNRPCTPVLRPLGRDYGVYMLPNGSGGNVLYFTEFTW